MAGNAAFPTKSQRCPLPAGTEFWSPFVFWLDALGFRHAQQHQSPLGSALLLRHGRTRGSVLAHTPHWLLRGGLSSWSRHAFSGTSRAPALGRHLRLCRFLLLLHGTGVCMTATPRCCLLVR